MEIHFREIPYIFLLFSIAAAQNCDPNTVEHTWQQGQNNKLKIDVPAKIFKWRVEIEYDEAPKRIDAYQGKGEKCKKKDNICWFNSENWNKRKKEGDVLDLGYQIQFKDSPDAPQIVKLTFKYCDARPCGKWKTPDDTIKEIVLCPSEDSTDATTEEPTDSSTEEPTEASTGQSTENPSESTSAAPGGGCLGSLMDFHAWDSGSTGKFEIIVPEDTETWEMTVNFDQPIDRFEAYQGSEVECEDMTCTFTNANWNGNKKAGDILDLTFQSNGDNPEITSFAFNGALCDEPPTTTAGPAEETTDGPTEQPTDEPTDVTTEGSTVEPTVSPSEGTTEVTTDGQPGTCELGDDIEGATKGHITHYSSNPTGGNCDLDWNALSDSGLMGWTHFAALPKSGDPDVDRYEGGANCGRCVRVRCSCEQETDYAQGACQQGGEETILFVVDSCPSCPYVGDIDTSTDGWNSLTGNEAFSKYDGTWEFVECPETYVTGPLKLRFKEGSSKWWYALQPINHRTKITNMEIAFGGESKELVFGNFEGFWWNGTEEISFPATITITNSEGDTASVTLNGEEDISTENELVLSGEL